MMYPPLNLELTTLGKALKAKIEAGNGTVPLKITRIVTGSGQSDDPYNQTTVINERQEFTILYQKSLGPRSIINARLSNAGIITGYSLCQIGFYAIDPDNGEILYRLSQFETPGYVPSISERAWTYEPTFNFVTGNASAVNIDVTAPGSISDYDVWGSVEYSSQHVPYRGTRIHYYAIKDIANYKYATPPRKPMMLRLSDGTLKPALIRSSDGTIHPAELQMI